MLWLRLFIEIGRLVCTGEVGVGPEAMVRRNGMLNARLRKAPEMTRSPASAFRDAMGAARAGGERISITGALLTKIDMSHRKIATPTIVQGRPLLSIAGGRSSRVA